MNIENRRLTLALAIVGLTASGGLIAQEQFPVANSAAGCDDMNWHQTLVDQYPKVIAACQDVVVAQDGSKWARFGSSFIRQGNDGTLVFAIQGPNKRRVQEITLTPGVDQVAYISGRETEFKDLRNGQALNLYIPEGNSGFTTEVGVVTEVAVMPINVVETRSNAKPLDQKAVTLDNVHFTLNSAELTPAAKLTLDEYARDFFSNADTNYLITGNTSASGSQEYNQALSERRAKAVMDYLVNVRNVDASRLSTVGYGEMRPIAREAPDGSVNSTEAKANMRVGFELASN